MWFTTAPLLWIFRPGALTGVNTDRYSNVGLWWDSNTSVSQFNAWVLISCHTPYYLGHPSEEKVMLAMNMRGMPGILFFLKRLLRCRSHHCKVNVRVHHVAGSRFYPLNLPSHFPFVTDKIWKIHLISFSLIYNLTDTRWNQAGAFLHRDQSAANFEKMSNTTYDMLCMETGSKLQPTRNDMLWNRTLRPCHQQS
jgi:hypothetical protein